MKSYLKFLTVAALIVAFASCDKEELPEGLPDCVADKIDQYKDAVGTTSCDQAYVKSYSFQGQTVYLAYDGSACVDGGETVFTNDCEELCFLGGLAGIKDCNGEDFYENAQLIEVIWEEER